VTADNVIADNTVEHIGRGELNDLAAIYTRGISPRSLISGNMVSNVLSFEGDMAYGVYLDEGEQREIVF
jgi:hypothetical protein